jgi:hypothetical protein
MQYMTAFFYVLLFVWFFFRKYNGIHHTGLYIITKRQVEKRGEKNRGEIISLSFPVHDFR